jgi:hypothetical protein
MTSQFAIPVPPGVSLTPSQRQFLGWLREFNPTALSDAIASANRSTARSSRSMLAGLGSWWGSLTGALSSIGSSVASAAKTVVPGLLQYEGQRKIMDLQIARANRGLAPLNTSQLTLPAFQVQVAPSPQVTANLRAAVEAGTHKTWLYVAGAIVLVGGLWLVMRRR